MSLAELLSDVVNPAAMLTAVLIGGFQTAHQTGDRLIHPLNGDGRATLGGLQTGGDSIDRCTETVGVLVSTVGVVQTTAATTAFKNVGGMRTARQGRVALVLVAIFHDHGVQPLTERHAGATREVLGDLASLGVYPLHAPRRSCAH